MKGLITLKRSEISWGHMKYLSVQHENDYGKCIKHQHNILAISSFNKKNKKFRPSKTVDKILQHAHHDYSKWC